MSFSTKLFPTAEVPEHLRHRSDGRIGALSPVTTLTFRNGRTLQYRGMVNEEALTILRYFPDGECYHGIPLDQECARCEQPGDAPDPAPPHRRHEVKVKIGGDTWPDVLGSLREILQNLETCEGAAGINCAQGGPGAGYYVDGSENPEMTPERYHEELHAYVQARRQDCCAGVSDR